MSRPRLLDLFCGAGGAAMGYSRAGFDVVGVDINPQPHYPFEFHQADALEVLDDMATGHFPWGGFDAIHASPPCQAYSRITAQFGKPGDWADLVAPVRAAFVMSGFPWVIENVVGAPLLSPVMLCGTSFGLGVRRHRLFEMSDPPVLVPWCNHYRHRAMNVTGHPGGHSRRDPDALFGKLPDWKAAMGIDWAVTAHECKEAIPPAYTEWIGAQLLRALGVAA
jgi:DNA (cytosine-5)-methyltransferase 1